MRMLRREVRTAQMRTKSRIEASHVKEAQPMRRGTERENTGREKELHKGFGDKKYIKKPNEGHCVRRAM